jgi:hypothetical protein
MKSAGLSRWYKVAAFLGAIGIPLLLTIGPLAVRDSFLLATTLAGVELLYLSVVLSTTLLLRSDIERKLKGLAPVESISEAEWYGRFLGALHGARTRVKLSYMSNKSPLDSKDSAVKAYYQKLPAEIRKKAPVEFRRLVRAVPGLRNWIEEMVSTLGNVSTFSLGCLPDGEPQVDAVATVSVQCIDEDQVFFVAVGEQQESRGPRDLYVESEEFNRIWNQYYDRLWNRAILVVNRGRIDGVALAKVRELIKG